MLNNNSQTYNQDSPLIIDLSQTLEEGIPLAKMLPPFQLRGVSRINAGQNLNVSVMELSEHTGTHMDVPNHVYEHGKTVDEVAPDILVGPILVYDFSSVPVEKGISRHDLLEYEQRVNIKAKEGTVVLLYTNHDRLWNTTPSGQAYLQNRPYLTNDLANEFVDRHIKAVGMDMGGPDPLGGSGHPVHEILLGAEVYIIESLRDIKRVPQRGYTFLGFPLLIKNGSGSPIRALAVSRKYLQNLVHLAENY